MTKSQCNVLKVCVLGDPGVGKTSLVGCLAGETFAERYITTVGADARRVEVGLTAPCFSSGWLQRLVLWDITGHAGPDFMGPVLRGADIVLVVADATRLDTQLNIWKWVEGVRTAAGSLPVMLVVNKSDILGPDFDPSPVMELAREYGAPYRQTSARTGWNVTAVLSELVIRHDRLRSAIEGRPAAIPPTPRLALAGARFDRWDFSAGFWPGDPGPAGWPDPHGSCVLGHRAFRARG
jgi:small GTP-binding protein